VLNFTDYSGLSTEANDFTLKETVIPDKVTAVEVAYDGGRLYIYINNELVLEKLDAGSDFRVTIGDL
jgi:hypothetical protein